ncbi:MAG: hypothetical protein KKG60_03740 [Nanoarchaeota archaeon]|nr:hypothetical protein [Nanoarchaeota archaeon]
MTQEIRVKVSEKMDDIVGKIADSIGVKKTEYVKSLIVQELRKRGVKIGE